MPVCLVSLSRDEQQRDRDGSRGSAAAAAELSCALPAQQSPVTRAGDTHSGHWGSVLLSWVLSECLQLSAEPPSQVPVLPVP